MRKILRFSLVLISIAIAILLMAIAIYFLVLHYSKAQEGWIILIWNNILYWLVFSFIMSYLSYKLLPSDKLRATFQNDNLGSIGEIRIDIGGAIIIFFVFLLVLYFSVVNIIFEEIINKSRIVEDPLKMEELIVQLKILDSNKQELSLTRTRDLIAKHSKVEIIPKSYDTERRKIIKIKVPVRENTTKMLVPTSDRFEKDFFHRFQINIEDPDNNKYYTTGRNYGIDNFRVVATNELLRFKRENDAELDCELTQGTIHVNRNEKKSWLDCFITLREINK